MKLNLFILRSEKYEKTLLSYPDHAVYKNELLYSSKRKNTRLYEIVIPHQQGLKAHIHTSGEDCAPVLSGNLTYFVGNRETIKAGPGSVVFGWQNVLHGYLNEEKEPVRLLVFVTPDKIGLAYPDDHDPVVRKIAVEHRKVHADKVGKRFVRLFIVSDRSCPWPVRGTWGKGYV